MASASLKATRMELLRLKRKKSLAVKGHKLLKQKRDALISEFFKLMDELKESAKKTEEVLAKAYKSLILAQGLSGYNEVKLAADSNRNKLDLKGDTRTIMGVKVPRLGYEEVKGGGRGYSLLSSSVELDQAATDFEDSLKVLITLAELQATAEKLADEIKKTKRKVNSLEQIVIPRIEDDIAMITMRLEEMERENFARLKVIKAQMTES